MRRFTNLLKQIAPSRVIHRVPAAPIVPVRCASAAASSGKLNVKQLSDKDLRGKNVLVRVDFNVPQDKKTGQITDDTRIRAALPTIEYLTKNGARVILVTHLGRPDGKVSDKYRLTPVSKRLSELLGKTVKQCSDSIGPEVKQCVQGLQPGEVALLENVRFHAEEESNDPKFAKQLVEDTGAQVYVNDAFGTAHRAHASTAGVCQFVKGPSVAGLLMDKEIRYLSQAVKNPAKPFTAIVGGAKVSTKLPVLKSLLQTTDTIVIGGAMMFTFLKSRGLNVGKSMVEDKFVPMAKELVEEAKTKKVDFYVPEDVIVAKEFKADAESKVVAVDKIPDDWMGMDIGPKSLQAIRERVLKSKTVVWNGPLGVFEMPAFAKGTLGVAQAMADATAKGATTIVGGGESVMAVGQAGLTEKLSHVSTGGGASLEMLEGQELPGVAALADNKQA